jgi:hypothetical protein
MEGLMQRRQVSSSERQHFEDVLRDNGDDPSEFEIDDSAEVFGSNNIVVIVRRRNGKEGIYGAQEGISWVPEFEQRLKQGDFR